MFGRTGVETEGNERVDTLDKLDGTTGTELGASITTDTDDDFSDWLVIF